MCRLGILVLLSTLALAQNAPQQPGNPFQIGDPRLNGNANPSGDFVNPHVLEKHSAPSSPLDSLRLAMAKQSLEKHAMQVQPRDNVCYAIRSYIFTREDSRAPVLVKTTTCTHVLVGVQKAVQHRVRVVPAN